MKAPEKNGMCDDVIGVFRGFPKSKISGIWRKLYRNFRTVSSLYSVHWSMHVFYNRGWIYFQNIVAINGYPCTFFVTSSLYDVTPDLWIYAEIRLFQGIYRFLHVIHFILQFFMIVMCYEQIQCTWKKVGVSDDVIGSWGIPQAENITYL